MRSVTVATGYTIPPNDRGVPAHWRSRPEPCECCGQMGHWWWDAVACPFCGLADEVYETDCWGHPFDYFTCDRCGSYVMGFDHETWWDHRDPNGPLLRGRMPDPAPRIVENWYVEIVYVDGKEVRSPVCWAARAWGLAADA